MYLKYYTLVWADVEKTHFETYEYVAWFWRDNTGEYGPLRSFKVPYNGKGVLDLQCHDGDVVDPGTSAEAS